MLRWFAVNKFIILLVFVAIAGVGIYFKGFTDGKNRQAATQAAAEREAVVKGRWIEKEIMRLPKNEVQTRLEEKWCRDCV